MLNEKKRVAILATHGFEEIELVEPKTAMESEGFEVDIIAPTSGTIKSWNKDNWGKDIEVDKTVDEVKAEDYHGLMLPGGVINPDSLRRNDKAVNFVGIFSKNTNP